MPDIFIAKKKSKANIDSSFEKKIDHHKKNPQEKGLKISKKISFSNQKEDEEIILFLRAHFITNFPWITISVILIILPIIILIISNFIDSSLPFFRADKICLDRFH